MNKDKTFFPPSFLPLVHISSTAVSGGLVKPGEAISLNVGGSNHMLAVLVGLFSSITGGISYCLIKAGANASDQPL